jgi:hypothetical protein
LTIPPPYHDASTTEASTGCEAENAFNREEEGKEIRRGRSLAATGRDHSHSPFSSYFEFDKRK